MNIDLNKGQPTGADAMEQTIELNPTGHATIEVYLKLTKVDIMVMKQAMTLLGRKLTEHHKDKGATLNLYKAMYERIITSINTVQDKLNEADNVNVV